jgi:amidase
VLAISIEEIRLGTAAPFAVTLAFGQGSAYVSADMEGMPAAGDTKICPLASAGSVLYLPVNVPGALLSLGDVHALMGEAEITGTALETSGDVTVTITILPAGTRHLNLPHLDAAELIGAVGCVSGANLQANLEAAMVEIHRRLTDEYGLTLADAYHLTGATARVVINQCVLPPNWSAVYVGVPRRILHTEQHAGNEPSR